MEKTKTGHSRAWHRRDAELDSAVRHTALPGLWFLTPHEFDAQRPRLAGHVLGLIGFGHERPVIRAADHPFVWIPVPLLAGDAMLEVWTSDAPVVRDDAHGIAAAHNGEVLFGCLEIPEEGNLEAATYQAYCRVFDYLGSRGYGNLLRVWNYFPHINDDTDGLERYRKFSIGRHDAFIASRGGIGQTEIPAACALGSQRGALVIYFLASRKPGQPVENPRQISAYHYPAQYGPRSPTFSRAMLMQTERESALFISGTASIVGHETRHAGDANEQAQETLTNIGAVVTRAAAEQTAPAGDYEVYLKAYLRDPAYLPVVQTQVRKAFGDTAKVIYLQADICRADLLLEIEGVFFDRRGLVA